MRAEYRKLVKYEMKFKAFMRCDQSGPIIQVKEEVSPPKIPFYGFGKDKPGEHPCGCEPTGSEEFNWPTRCSDHNKQFMKWKRIKQTKLKFVDTFDRNRHRFIKMLTFGIKRTEKQKDKLTRESEINSDHKYWRTELRYKFNRLRKDKWWRKHVDGGIWFYETVLTELDPKTQGTFEEEQHDMNDMRIKIHPHFHCMILGPKNLAGPERNFSELNALFEKHGLGKPSVSVARTKPTRREKTGRPINASLNKSLWYLTNYLKKQEHAEGINRGSFGIFNQKK